MFNRECPDKLQTLNRIANLHMSINPVLNELGKQLKKAYAENEESLSIIFTKTRASAKALVKWLNEDPDLNHINADILIGSGNQGRVVILFILYIYFSSSFI